MTERFGGIRQHYTAQYFLWEIERPGEKSCLLVSPSAEKKIKAIFRAEMRKHKFHCFLKAFLYKWGTYLNGR